MHGKHLITCSQKVQLRQYPKETNYVGIAICLMEINPGYNITFPIRSFKIGNIDQAKKYFFLHF